MNILYPIILIILIQSIRKAIKKESISQYLFSILLGVDQLGGSIIYGLEDWTISSVAHFDAKNNHNKWFERFINTLFFWEKEHCKNSFEKEYTVLGYLPNRPYLKKREK